MTQQIVFCSDAVLRVKEEFDSVMLPLVALEKNQITKEKSNPFFLLSYFKSQALIEKGTTLTDMILAIEPWADLLASYLNVDMRAYIKEIRKPSEVMSDNKKSWIGVGRTIYISLDFKPLEKQFESSEEEMADIFRFGESEESDELEDNFTFIDTRYASHYTYGRKGSGGFYDIDKVKHAPVFIKDCLELSSVKSSTSEQTLFNEKAHSLLKDKKLRLLEMKSHFNPITFIDVLDAIFNDGFGCESPERLEAERREIERTLNKYDDELIIEDSNETMNIVFSESAQNDIVNMITSQMEGWEHLKKEISARSDVVMRIGTLKEAQPPEHRWYGNIVED